MVRLAHEQDLEGRGDKKTPFRFAASFLKEHDRVVEQLADRLEESGVEYGPETINLLFEFLGHLYDVEIL
ncbi:hypothetical protein KKG63_00745 [Patescibacteria group bacterium]|nr:hypothetical protein [Patescibacteria group bacterium]